MRLLANAVSALCLILSTFLNLTVSASEVNAMTATLTKQQADQILSSSKFKRVKSKSDFPTDWSKGMNLGDMSDVDGPFSSGCTGPEPHLRMVTGAVSDKYALIIYEQGGIAYFRTLNLFSRDNGGVSCVYSEKPDQTRIEDIESKIGQ